MKRKIIIVTSSYGADYLQQLGGQHGILDLIQKSRADGVEIRRELFSTEALTQLPALARQIALTKLDCFYSVPFALFGKQSELNADLATYFAEAAVLNATLLKFSLGHFNYEMSSQQVEQLKQLLSSYPKIQCVIENDQTPESGNLAAMAAFTTTIAQHNLPLKLAFDCGNWCWVGEDPVLAAKTLANHIAYIHIKATQLDATGKRIAVPLTGREDKCLQLVRQYFPTDITRGIEFPLNGEDLLAVSRHFVDLLKE